METITTNKRFIRASVMLVSLLSLFVIALFINEIKASKYIGRTTQVANTITVSGEGEVSAIPDIAMLTVNVSKDAKTTREAQDMLNASVTKVLEYIRSQGIEERDVKSEYGGVNPRYQYDNKMIACITYPCNPSTPTIVGYTASQSISIKIRNVDAANDVRTGLANIGITDISGPTFSIDDETGLQDQAREKAIDDAKEKAKVLAKQLNVDLGTVVSFSENGRGGFPMYYKADVMNEAAIAVPAPTLPRGENKIMSTVTITYEIK